MDLEDSSLPETVTTKELAYLFDVTPRRVLDMVKAGLPKIARNTYPLAEALQWYISFWRDRAEGREEPEDEDKVGPLNQLRLVRIRLNEAKAEDAELDLAQKKGELIHIDDYLDELQAAIQPVRSRLLGAPDRIVPELAEADSEEEMRARMERVVREILEDLRQSLRNGGGEEP